MWCRIFVLVLVLFPIYRGFAEPKDEEEALVDTAKALYQRAYEHERVSPEQRIQAALEHYRIWDLITTKAINGTAVQVRRVGIIGHPRIDDLLSSFLKSRSRKKKLAALEVLEHSHSSLPKNLGSFWGEILGLTEDKDLEVRLAAYRNFHHVDAHLALRQPHYPVQKLADIFSMETRSIRAQREVVKAMEELLARYRNDDRINKKLDTPEIVEPIERLVQQAIVANHPEVSSRALSIIESNSFAVSQPFIENLLRTLLDPKLADLPGLNAGLAISKILEKYRLRDTTPRKIFVEVLGKRENEIWELVKSSPHLKEVGVDLSEFIMNHGFPLNAESAIQTLGKYAIADSPVSNGRHRRKALAMMALIPIPANQNPPREMVDILDHPHILNVSNSESYRALLSRVLERVHYAKIGEPIRKWFEDKLLAMLDNADARANSVAKEVLSKYTKPSYGLVDRLASLVDDPNENTRSNVRDIFVAWNRNGLVIPYIQSTLQHAQVPNQFRLLPALRLIELLKLGSGSMQSFIVDGALGPDSDEMVQMRAIETLLAMPRLEHDTIQALTDAMDRNPVIPKRFSEQFTAQLASSNAIPRGNVEIFHAIQAELEKRRRARAPSPRARLGQVVRSFFNRIGCGPQVERLVGSFFR